MLLTALPVSSKECVVQLGKRKVTHLQNDKAYNNGNSGSSHVLFSSNNNKKNISKCHLLHLCGLII